MLGLDAPRQMIALVMAMLATVSAILPITAFWKISVHTSVASGAVAALAVGVSAWCWAAFPLVAVIGWSRVVLRDHTPGQVVAGAALGAPVAGAAFALLA